MKDIKYIIADNVRIYRKKGNLTQSNLAELAELSLETIKRIEGGKITLSLENFIRISKALKVPITYLLYDPLDMPDTERMLCIISRKDEKQKAYLFHMLQEMAEGMDKLL